jgi:hypothetical protein
MKLGALQILSRNPITEAPKPIEIVNGLWSFFFFSCKHTNKNDDILEAEKALTGAWIAGLRTAVV